MLREAKNQVYVEGILSEVNIAKNSRVVDGQPINYINGHIILRVEHVVEGVPVISEVPIQVYSNEFKKGTTEVSKLYLGFETVMDTYKSIAAVGIEEADRVRISGAKIRDNVFFASDGTERHITQIQANFISRIPDHELNPQSNFVNEIFFAGIKPLETDDGKLKYEVTGVVPGWQGRIQVLKYVVYNPAIIDFLETSVQVGDTLQFNGIGVFSAEEYTIQQEVAVGDAPSRTYTRRNQELVVTSSSYPYEGELAFSEDDIVEAKAEYDRFLAEKKEKDMNRQASKATPPPMTDKGQKNFGF